MPPTVRWLLDQSATSPLVLLAGQKGVDRKITSVNIMDSPRTLDYLGEDELVLASGYIFQENTELLSRFIGELDKRRCAGVGFVLTGYMEKLPDEIICQANHRAFPVFSIPYELSLSEINALVYGKIYKDSMTEAEQIVEAYNQLMTALEQDLSGEDLLGRVIGVVERTAILTDREFRPIACAVCEGERTEVLRQFFNMTNHTLSVLPSKVCTELTDELQGSNSFAVARLLRKGALSQSLYVMPIKDSNRTQGFLCLCSCAEPLQAFQLHYLRTIIPILSLFLAKCSARSRSNPNTSAGLLGLLLSSASVPYTDLENICKLHRFDGSSLRVCAVIRLDDMDGKPARFSQATENLAQECVAACVSALHLNSFRVAYQGQILCFLFFKDSTRVFDALKQGEEAISVIHQRLLEANIPNTIGISRACRGIDTLRDAVHQAFDALDLGSRIKPGERIHSFSRNQIYHLLAGSLSKQAAWEIYRDNLGELHDFDRQNQSEYEKTLRCYLENQLKISDTARELYLHRNTLSGRIEKLKELLDGDLHDLSFLNRLFTSFYISDLLENGVFDRQSITLSRSSLSDSMQK